MGFGDGVRTKLALFLLYPGQKNQVYKQRQEEGRHADA